MTQNKQYKHLFGWGDTYGIREAIIKTAPWLLLSPQPIASFGYPKHEGEESLVKLIGKLCKTLTGNKYKYVLVTQGCTHALNAYVWAEKDKELKAGDQDLATKSFYFPFYPGIAKNQGLRHAPGEIGKLYKAIQIIDSPSNPIGEITYGDLGRSVWDAAYYTPTYGVSTANLDKKQTGIPAHIAMAGSLSKFSGINGIRIGWLATNDKHLYAQAASWISHDICGVSWPSQWLAEQILTKVDLEKFWKASRLVIDNNKNEIQKLSLIFGNQELPKVGMFALFEVDKKLKKLLEKASVSTMPGHLCGDKRDSVRINLAHTNEATKEMVKDILKADKKL